MEDFLESLSCTPLRLDKDICKMYLQNITNILAQYSWIYNVRNVDIFLFDVLEKIPTEWVEVLSDLNEEELWKLPFDFLKDEWPTSLKQFISQCNELTNLRFPPKKFQDTIKEKNPHILKKITDKKVLEVEIMSHLVHKISQVVKCTVVLDVGSGLGYLDQALHYNFKICSIGLDSVSRYTLAAKERLQADPCKHSILYETLEVKNSETCLLALEDIIQRGKSLYCSCNSNISSFAEQQSTSVVMIGLHSCGNLTQDMMKLFCKLEEIKAFICVGCCYNKISLSDFPMSAVAKSAIDVTHSSYPLWYPCTSGLRIASHGTRSHIAAHHSSLGNERERNLFYRALLQCFIKKENIVWRHPKRHVRSAYLYDFQTYCYKMFEGHTLSGNQETTNKLNSLYKEKEWLFNRIRILLVLQTMLQPLWETFVTLDRLMYFREKNMTAEVLAMWNDTMSSRNLALFAYKS